MCLLVPVAKKNEAARYSGTTRQKTNFSFYPIYVDTVCTHETDQGINHILINSGNFVAPYITKEPDFILHQER